MAVDWRDYGADDYCAVFSGKAGKVTLLKSVRINRLEFHADGYELRGESLALSGEKPAIYLADRVKATLALQVKMPDGSVLAPGSYDAKSHPHIISGKGLLQIESVPEAK
jgi:hypothetical protein